MERIAPQTAEQYATQEYNSMVVDLFDRVPMAEIQVSQNLVRYFMDKIKERLAEDFASGFKKPAWLESADAADSKSAV